MDSGKALLLVKITHTVVWAFLASCILALPIVALAGHLGWALVITGLVVCECGVLVANRWRCPLTDLAGRFTDDRADNFDIYLPRWIASYNKQIFGTLFVLGELVVVWRWLR